MGRSSMGQEKKTTLNIGYNPCGVGASDKRDYFEGKNRASAVRRFREFPHVP